MTEGAQFIGALEGRGCLTFSGDGSAIVKITVPASEIAGVAQLLRYKETPLRITIEPQKG